MQEDEEAGTKEIYRGSRARREEGRGGAGGSGRAGGRASRCRTAKGEFVVDVRPERRGHVTLDGRTDGRRDEKLERGERVGSRSDRHLSNRIRCTCRDSAAKESNGL